MDNHPCVYQSSLIPVDFRLYKTFRSDNRCFWALIYYRIWIQQRYHTYSCSLVTRIIGVAVGPNLWSVEGGHNDTKVTRRVYIIEPLCCNRFISRFMRICIRYSNSPSARKSDMKQSIERPGTAWQQHSLSSWWRQPASTDSSSKYICESCWSPDIECPCRRAYESSFCCFVNTNKLWPSPKNHSAIHASNPPSEPHHILEPICAEFSEWDSLHEISAESWLRDDIPCSAASNVQSSSKYKSESSV